MPSRFVRFDPDTVQILDKCLARALEIALELDPEGRENESRFAAALIEAMTLGETDEAALVDFALQVLPAYRESPLDWRRENAASRALNPRPS
ncbi:hypothetical protein [Ancylobacter terrae]|uniref:hypothetical protein n=1 Tax=Ancylobacter sp. sgz301288 TaxID=3342077 RepID=UPI00385FE8A9